MSDERGIGYDLICERLPYGRLWYQSESAAIGYAKYYSRGEGCKIEVFNEKGELIRTEEIEPEDFKCWG